MLPAGMLAMLAGETMKVIDPDVKLPTARYGTEGARRPLTRKVLLVGLRVFTLMDVLL